MSKEKKPFDYACPYCKQKFEVPHEMIGQETTCPSCNKVFKIAQPYTHIPGVNMICPNTNCNYKGKPKKVPRGSIIVGLCLLLLIILPGLFYFLFFGGYRYRCPHCGLQIACDN